MSLVTKIIDLRKEALIKGNELKYYRATDDELRDLFLNDQYFAPEERAFLAPYILPDSAKEQKKEDLVIIIKSMLKNNPLVLFGVELIPDTPLYSRGKFKGI